MNIFSVIYTSYSLIQTAVKNVFKRRGRKSDANVPIFKDTKTMDPFVEEFDNKLADRWSKPDHIYLDAQAFGWGSCAVQATMLGSSLDEALHIHDQLVAITPIALALTACTPIQRGYITDWDCRWSMLTAIGDDRTAEELGQVPISSDGLRINKSRYDTIEMYLSEQNQRYNDNHIPYNEEYYDLLVAGGLKPSLAKHFAYFFIRDPICMFAKELEETKDNVDINLNVILS